MNNVVCWDRQQIHSIINPEAESVDDHVFRAVHTEQRLSVARPAGDRFQMLSAGAFKHVSQTELLDEFLRPDLRHVQLAVFGRSGSGKSHLIHWMRMAIPSTPERLVLTIPKAGTSLRSIVEMIIDELDPVYQQPFRESLDRAGDSVLTREGQKHELLNQLAQAIREDAALGNPQQRSEVDQELLDRLPDLFQDAYIRRAHFLKDGGVIDALVDHVFTVRSRYDPSEDRYLFAAQDLPSGSLDWKDASKPAKSAIQVLMLPDILPTAVKIVNRNLDGAIARALSFSGDRVTALLNELRRHLRRKGQELILLIEDIARLQGIDRALLQALLTQGDGDLCDIRWAIAATRGFFETIADTVYTRMTSLVDMDRSVDGRSGRLTEKALARFAGRYLNAVRLGSGALVEWAKTAEPGEQAPNACDVCSYRDECHRTFKTSDDSFGLYPFTARALWNMAMRASGQIETSFNPRIIQRSVLVRVLDEHEHDLRVGAFPPKTLLVELDGVKGLSTVEIDKLRRSISTAQFDRALTLHELWDGSAKLRQLPRGLTDAFGLPAIDGDVSPVNDVTIDEDGRAENGRKESTSGPTDLRLQHLDSWAAGGPFEQDKVPKLRELVYSAVEAAIDWDGEALERSAFAGAVANRPFRRRCIYFQRQDTAPQATIQLDVPASGASDATFRRTALALQGLILASEHNGEWTFENGSIMLSALQDCLGEWSADVVSKLKALPGLGPGWDPIIAASELLGVGACLSGAARPGIDALDLLNASLSVWPTEAVLYSPALQRAAQSIAKQRDKFVDLIRSISSGTKGGRVGAFLNPGSVLPALQTLRRRGWKLSQVPPEDEPRAGWDVIAKTYRDVLATLDAAAVAEREARLAWLTEVENAFGPDARRATVLEALSVLRDAAVAAGVAGRRANALRERLEQFAVVQFDDAVRAATTLREDADPLSFLPHYGRARAPAVDASRALIVEARTFVQNVEAEVLNLETQFSGEGSVQSGLEEMETSLRAISDALAECQ